MKNKKGFTLAEVLIVLAVIGIIAAITINIINTNIREAEVEAKLKKTVAVLNGAIRKATIDHGASYSWAEMRNPNNLDQNVFGVLNKYIAPYIMTLKPMEELTLKELGYSQNIKNPNGGNFTLAGTITSKRPRIFLNDGTILLNIQYYAYSYTMVVDINGRKGPNVAGRDVFVLGVDTTKEVPYVKMLQNQRYSSNDPITGEKVYTQAPRDSLISSCKLNGAYCGQMIEMNSWKIPSDYPVKI